MSSGAAALDDVYAKLDWATRHHDDMLGLFEQFARPGSSDERPYGIKFHELDRPAGLIVARFIAEEPMPVEISLLAADLVHNARAALDHVLARLKEHFGGDVGHGSFPTWSSQALWEEKVANAGKRSPLRRLNQAARYHKVVGGERCPIVDTWWQTETGHIMISPLPGITATKPGSATQPLPGIVAGVVTESGEDAGTSQGLLTLRYPWPGMLRTLYRDDERFLETYWSKRDAGAGVGDRGARG